MPKPCKGGLANGVHILSDIDELKTYLTGTPLRIAEANVRRHGAVRVLINYDHIPLAIEPYDFGQDREAETICRIPPSLMSRVVRPRAVRSGLGGSKLTADEREYIRQSNESGQTLAARYGVSRQAIHTIRTYQPKPRKKRS